MTARERASALAVLAAMAAVVLDSGLVNLGLPALASSFGLVPGRAILVVSGYQAALLASLLPSAQVAERFGARKVFALGASLFGAASVLASLAPSFAILIVARILQGLGGAAIMAIGIALLRSALGSERLGAAIAWNALTVASCSAAGPVAGGLILSIGPWPWLFLATLPMILLTLAAAAALPKVPSTRASLDLASISLHGLTVGLALTAAEAAVSRPVLALLLGTAAAACAALLLARQRRRQMPLLPLDLLRLAPLRTAALASICCFAGQSAGLLALPLYLQLSLGRGAASAGFVLACWPLSVAATSRLANRLAGRLGSPSLCAAGAAALAIGLLVSALVPSGGPLWALPAAAAVSGAGFGLFQVPNNRTLFLSAPVARSAAAGGLQGSARLTGQMIGAVTMSLLFAWLPSAVAPRAGFLLGALFAAAAAVISGRAISAVAAPLHRRTVVERVRNGAGATPFARIGMFDTAGCSLPALVTFFRDEVVPRYATCEGFLGYHAFSEPRSGRYVGLSYWSSRQALDASDAIGLQSREGAARLGARIVGEAMFVEQEFCFLPGQAAS
jgi:DHA2 family multidrug resistance protein-like MFS transporter